MKKNVRTITCAALSMLLVNSGMVLYAKDDETEKDETVYAMLHSDGRQHPAEIIPEKQSLRRLQQERQLERQRIRRERVRKERVQRGKRQF